MNIGNNLNPLLFGGGETTKTFDQQLTTLNIMLYTEFLTKRKYTLQSEIEEILERMEKITETIGSLKKKTDYYYILVYRHDELYDTVMKKISDLNTLNAEIFAIKTIFGEE